MKVKTKQVYYCEHCDKHGLSKNKMEYHEEICFKNIENDRPCFNCSYLCRKETEICGNYYNGEDWNRKVVLFYCSKKECFLYTPQNQIKENWFDLGDCENLPMPKKCEDYKPNSYYTL